MDASSPPAFPRRRFSVLLGPWHTSSRVAAMLMLLFLVFCNVPGQHVKRIWYEVGHPFYVKSQFEHGWPLTYLVRAIPYPELPSPSIVILSPDITIRGCFELWSDIEEIRSGVLLANGCVVLLGSLACGVLFEARRRARRRLWHIHLRDLFAVTLVVSLVGAWYVYAKRRFDAENAVLFGSDGHSGHVDSQYYQQGGPTWLCLLASDEHSNHFLDRPFGATIADGQGWFQLERLTSVRQVHTRRRATTDELANLARMPRLEALDLDDDWETPDDEVVAELPPLPRLRGLSLCQPPSRCRGINRLTSLEALRITREVDDQTLREISELRNLRQLALDNLPESADLTFLRSLPKLSAVDFYNSSLSAAALRSIGQCRSLKVVSFYMADVDGHGIRHLSNLANLEDLDLSYTDVTSQDVVPLAVLKRLRNLNLNETQVSDLSFVSALENLETLSLYNTEVTGENLAPLIGLKKLHSLDLGYAPVGTDGLVYLRQMKQLQWLRISGVRRDEEKSFQAQLPNCEIIFH